jgi:HAE1 family hydrophobic/amphiphilic exporter-1
MTISDICIRRPVFTWVLVAAPVVLGLVSYAKLGVDLFPKVDFPVVSVVANLPGSSAENMETTVTKPIEEAINSVNGIDELRSTTREGQTTVTVQFVLEKDGAVAAQEVREKLAGIQKQLPSDVETPVVQRFDLDANPIITIGVSGRRHVREVTEIAKHQIQEQLQTLNGVGAVFVTGGQSRAINVILDTDALASYSLTSEDVRQALLNQNLEVPGGIIQQSPRELVLRTLGRVETPEQFNELVVATRKNVVIRIRDVGRAEDTIEEPRGLSRLDGANAVSLFIQKQSGTNTIEISDAVQAKLAKIAKTLPADIRVEIIQDQSRFVRKSMEEVKLHLLLAGILVSLTILLFIQDWRTTVIATLAIPTSIIPTFLFMHMMGFTLNNITMLALILAIGIVIDDAVVVHENIFRHMEEEGMDAMSAASLGTKEIALPVLATSLSLVVIFLPVAFMGGLVGRFFSSFGLTVAFAVMMSLFVSFTLTPMLCSRFLKLEVTPDHKAHSKSSLIYRIVDSFYGRALRWAIRHRIIVVILSLLVFLSTGPIAMRMGANLVPRDDQSEFQVTYKTPEHYDLESTTRVVTEIEDRLAQLPGVVHRFTTIGMNNNNSKGQGDVTRGSIYFRIKELDQRKYTQFDVMRRTREILKDYPDLRTAVTDVSVIQPNGQDTRLFQLNLVGPDLKKLETYSDTLKSRLSQSTGLVDVDTTLSLRKPELQVSIDRDRAGDLGIPVQNVATSLSVLVGGQAIGKYKEGTEQYDVWLRADRAFRSDPRSFATFMIPTPGGKMVPLGTLANFEEARGPAQIDRLNRQRIVTILGTPETISLGDAVKNSIEITKQMDLPPEYELVFVGQAKTLGDTGYYFMIALLLSILFMYLILAAQFESWIQPVSILTALPVTIPFGLLSLWLFGQPIDLYAMFGLFMLLGIVKKNGILQVDKTNELRKSGKGRDEAILEANQIRLRPILMTTVMLVAAMIPIALGEGPGSGARASMAKVIIGGQLFSLLLALLVTPVTYSLFESVRRRFRKKDYGQN